MIFCRWFVGLFGVQGLGLKFRVIVMHVCKLSWKGSTHKGYMLLLQGICLRRTLGL